MTKPDYVLISEVMLFSQGFRTAEVLSEKIVPLFKLCGEQLSAQSHYDFALRALKSVLVCSGVVKRSRIQKIKEKMQANGETNIDETAIAENLPEQVWPLTQFFLFPFCENSLICLEGKSMTPHRGNTIHFCSSQQLPRLCLGPSKGFLT